MSVSGGFGQIYEIIFLLINRRIKWRYLHHHAYSYIEKKSIITSILTKVSGKDCVHITQSKKMANNFKKTYYGLTNVIYISNVVFQEDSDDQNNFVRTSIKTIGFLSNITKQKGIYEFLDLAKKCNNNEINFLLAGPIPNYSLKNEVLGIISTLKNVDYIGTVFGKQKNIFFSLIDLFVFPTKYKNETEGIVNIEAIRSGAPVIAYGRGCIPEIIGEYAGHCMDPSDAFVTNALIKIDEWSNCPEQFKRISIQAIKRYKHLKSLNHIHLTSFINDIYNQ